MGNTTKDKQARKRKSGKRNEKCAVKSVKLTSSKRCKKSNVPPKNNINKTHEIEKFSEDLNLEYQIMETPRVKHESIYDFDIRNTSLEGSKCTTPILDVETTRHATPSFNSDEPMCIQDLNSLNKDDEEERQNYTRNLQRSSLNRLRSFTLRILNSTQDDCGSFCEIEKVDPDGLRFNSSLLQGKWTSTPVIWPVLDKSEHVASLGSKLEADVYNTSIFEQSSEVKSRKTRERFFNQNLEPIPYCNLNSANRGNVDASLFLDVCVKLLESLQNWHWHRYLTRVSTTIINPFAWMAATLVKGFSAFIEKHSSNSRSVVEHSDINSILLLKSTIEDLKMEICRMKSEHNEKIIEVIDGVNRIRNELKSCRDQQLLGLTSQTFAPSIPLPPPLPPPPPPLPCGLKALNKPILNRKSINVSNKSQMSNTSRPTISIDDILSVKLKKISDRPVRRMTAPQMSNILNQVKLKSTKPARQNSQIVPCGDLSLSQSPCSSLTRLLIKPNSNTRRVKRLQRPNAFSLDDYSKRLSGSRDIEF